MNRSAETASSVHYADETVTVHHGDCLEVLRRLPNASVDAIVTDPPYGLEFMGKDWDGADGFRRSLNPADAGRESVFGRTSRTSPEYQTASKAQAERRQEGGIRQATGPSFMGGLNPKCLICDKWQRGSNPCSCVEPHWTQERLVRLHSFQEWCEAWSRECLRVLHPGGHMLAFGGTRTFHRLACAVEDAGFEIRDSIAWLYGSGFPKSLNLVDENGERTGWGTALKPAHEPVVVARKPLTSTVAKNVAEHGTGALNIDACRTATTDALGGGAATKGSASHAEGWDRPWKNDPEAVAAHAERVSANVVRAESLGRWPANIIFDEARAAELDAQTGTLTSGKMRPTHTTAGRSVYGQDAEGGFTTMETYGDSGGASRFFYVAKAKKAERPVVDGVAHPTVKPLALMQWLVRLVTPEGGTVLEPFAGSGTTIEAAMREGFNVIAIERDASYLPLIQARIDRQKAIVPEPVEATLFDEETA